MTAGPISDPDVFLHEQLAQASPDLMRELLGTFINALLSAQADSVCGAEFGTRNPDRVTSRNGYRRHRDLDTRAATIDVAVPKLREGILLPGLASGAAPPRGGGADDGGGDVLPARGQHVPLGQAGPHAGGHWPVQVARLSGSQPSPRDLVTAPTKTRQARVRRTPRYGRPVGRSRRSATDRRLSRPAALGAIQSNPTERAAAPSILRHHG